MTTLRTMAGAIVLDLPRFANARWIDPAADAWAGFHNRDERLEAAPEGTGFRCTWKWTSLLHLCRVFPSTGRSLMRAALRAHPVELDFDRELREAAPEITFVVGHRGRARLPHLLATLASIASQRDARVEVIVVEQSVEPEAGGNLPFWVDWIHTPPPDTAMPYARAWAFNVGAQRARSNVLVFHDNDIVIPVDFARRVLDRVAMGFEFVDPKRFIFYLDNGSSADVARGDRNALAASTPDTVLQNAHGGTIAATREAFFAIGGFDESFIGWGAEDNDFHDRASTRRVWDWGFLPVFHLWHPAQAERVGSEAAPAIRLYHDVLAKIDPRVRIERLAKREQGRREGPNQGARDE